MIETVLELALSMGIINTVIWCLRIFVCHTKLRRLQRIEGHIHKCLSYSNLLFYHALEKDNWEADRELAIRDKQMSKISPEVRTLIPPIASPSSFGVTLEYKQHNGEILPYSKNMETLHKEAHAMRKQLFEMTEDSQLEVDMEFLSRDYGDIYPETFKPANGEDTERMTLYCFANMQSNYVDLFKVVCESVRLHQKKLEGLLTIILLIPEVKYRFERRIQTRTSVEILDESEKLRYKYMNLRSKTGADRIDGLSTP